MTKTAAAKKKQVIDEASEILDIKGAAKLLKCSVQTIRLYITSGTLPSSQPGAKGKHRKGGAPHRINRADVLALVPVGGAKKEGGAA